MSSKNKSISDLSQKHFSRLGEFLVSFELSKYGWNIYNPVYDEYIDLIIHKYVCKKCKKNWNQTPSLKCSKCSIDFSKSLKSKIIAKKVCLDCKNEWEGNRVQCVKCHSKDIRYIPTCHKCHSEVKMKILLCSCGSSEFVTILRTIQVKASRIEYDKETGITKRSYAVDMKPKDLISDGFHFYIWCLIDDKEQPHFLVMSVEEFKKTMGKSLKGTSFFKDQDRQHFSSVDFGKWKEYLNKFEKLE
mgnify:CR=1 FL=1